MLKANKKVLLEETIGTGLSTLLAKNLKLIDIDLPEKSKRHETDADALPKIQNVLGKGKIMVIPKPDGTIHIKTQGGVIIMTP